MLRKPTLGALNFGRAMTLDPQFARAGVNYLWAYVFGSGIVDPPDGWDLARVDPQYFANGLAAANLAPGVDRRAMGFVAEERFRLQLLDDLSIRLPVNRRTSISARIRRSCRRSSASRRQFTVLKAI